MKLSLIKVATDVIITSSLHKRGGAAPWRPSGSKVRDLTDHQHEQRGGGRRSDTMGPFWPQSLQDPTRHQHDMERGRAGWGVCTVEAFWQKART